MAGGGWPGLTTAAVSRFVLGQSGGRSVRLGRLLVTALRWLVDLVAFLDRAGVSRLTTELALA